MAVSRSLLPGSRRDVLSLYKSLLGLAKRFPSKKRAAMYEDIRAEFRDKAGLTDQAAIAHALEVAVRGLSTMEKYTGLSKSSKSWSVTLDQDPLGAGEAEARKQARSGSVIVDAGVGGTFGRLE